MKRYAFRSLRTGALALAVTMVAIGAEAAAPDRSAEAALWTLKFDPFGPFCEGCCTNPSNLCCEIGAACRHSYPAEPQGGG